MKKAAREERVNEHRVLLLPARDEFGDGLLRGSNVFEHGRELALLFRVISLASVGAQRLVMRQIFKRGLDDAAADLPRQSHRLGTATEGTLEGRDGVARTEGGGDLRIGGNVERGWGPVDLIAVGVGWWIEGAGHWSGRCDGFIRWCSPLCGRGSPRCYSSLLGRA